MIHRCAGPLFLFLWVVLPAGAGQAQKTPAVDLFEGLDSIRLSAAVGGPLDLEAAATPRLFVGELRRFNRFKQDLTEALAIKLSSCGLFVDDNAPDELAVEVFGRPVELQRGLSPYVFLIEVKVLNSKLKSASKEAGPITLSPVLGLADEAGLERTLIDTAVAAVSRELRSCHG